MPSFLTYSVAMALSPALLAVQIALAAETSQLSVFIANAAPRVDVLVRVGRELGLACTGYTFWLG